MTLVREAMVSDPRALPASATAQEAGELLARPEVLTVLVVDGEQLVGSLTRATLVERVVAAGLDPRSTRLAGIAEPVALTAGPDDSLEDTYRVMEAEDVERLPVIDGGRLVGVLSRSALQRRLAEDEPPVPSEEE